MKAIDLFRELFRERPYYFELGARFLPGSGRRTAPPQNELVMRRGELSQSPEQNSRRRRALTKTPLELLVSVKEVAAPHGLQALPNKFHLLRRTDMKNYLRHESMFYRVT